LFIEGLSLTLKGLSKNWANDLALTTASTGEAAIKTLSVDTDFDLILLDLSLPDGRGYSLLRYVQLKKLFIPVVILSASEQPNDVRDALRSGANGFISKGQGREGIQNAITQVMQGEIYLPPFIENSHILEETHIPTLTSRQYDVLRLLAQGMPNKRICRELDLTEHTVKTHLKTLFSLLDVHNRTECVQTAERLGLLKQMVNH
jgi:DNA-binding NarL/FixJ family response regulator